MANINDWLNNILTARYGEEVRASIYNSISLFNDILNKTSSQFNKDAAAVAAAVQTAQTAATNANTAKTRAETSAQNALVQANIAKDAKIVAQTAATNANTAKTAAEKAYSDTVKEKDNAIAAIAAQQTTSVKAVTDKGTEVTAAIAAQQTTSVKAVTDKGTEVTAAIAAQQTTSVNAVKSQQTTSTNAVKSAETEAIKNIGDAADEIIGGDNSVIGRTIKLTGSILGSGTFSADKQLEIVTKKNAAFCGAANKWYKLASITIPNTSHTSLYLLYQGTALMSEDTSQYVFGLQKIVVRGANPTHSKILWDYVNPNLPLENAVLLGNNEGTDVIFDLWFKSFNTNRNVKVIVLGSQYSLNGNEEPNLTLYNDKTGADILPESEYRVESQMSTLKTGEILTTASTPSAENSLVPKSYVLAKPVVHEIDLSDLTVYDDTKWYPCILTTNTYEKEGKIPGMYHLSVKTYSNATQTVSWSSHQKGPRCTLDASFLNSRWGMFASNDCYLIHKQLNTDVTPSDMHAIVISNQLANTTYGSAFLYLRAGVKYIYSCQSNEGIDMIFEVQKDGYTSGSTTISPTSTEPPMAESRTFPFTKLEVLDNPSKETEVVNLGYKRNNPWTYSLSNFLQESKYIIFTSEKNTTNAAHGATYLISGPGDYSGSNYGTYLVTLRVRSNSPAMTVIELSRADSSIKPEFGYYQTENTFYFGVKTPTYSSGPKLTVLHYINPYIDDGHSLNIGIVQTLTTAPTGWKPVEPKKVLVSSYGLVQEPIKIDKRSDTRSYSLQLMAGDAALTIESLKENPYTVLQLWGGDVQTDKDVVIRRVHTPINNNDATPRSYVDSRTPAGNNAGGHNGIYRGKNLGATINSTMLAAIKAGTFTDLYIGDYFVVGSQTYIIAAFDYPLYNSTKHNMVLVTKIPTGSYAYFNSNTSHTITMCEGFSFAALPTSLVAAANRPAVSESYGTSYRPSTGLFMNEAKKTVGSWFLSELQVFGNEIFSKFHGIEADTFIKSGTKYINDFQFPLFRLDPLSIKAASEYWLRDIYADSSNSTYGIVVSAAGERYGVNIMKNGTPTTTKKAVREYYIIQPA